MYSSLPYFCSINNKEIFAAINKQKALVFCTRSARGEWGKETVLLSDCKEFYTACDYKGMQHIFAKGLDESFHYFVLENDLADAQPFVPEQVEKIYALAFSAFAAEGYMLVLRENSMNAALFYTADDSWRQKIQLPGMSFSPYCMAVDRNGSIHLVALNEREHCLSYFIYSRYFRALQNKFVLDILSEWPVPLAVWLDEGQNIHIAWYNGEKVVCRMKSTGGWPAVGWHSEKSFAVESPPQFLSFCSAGGEVFLWGKMAENRILIYDVLHDELSSLEPAAEHSQLIRTGSPGQANLNLTNDGLPEKWLFPPRAPARDAESTGPREDESQLIIHARRLLAEKNSWKAHWLRKKQLLPSTGRCWGWPRSIKQNRLRSSKSS